MQMRTPEAVLVVAMMALAVRIPDLADLLLLAAAAVTIISGRPLRSCRPVRAADEGSARRQTTWSLTLERGHQRTVGPPPGGSEPPVGSNEDDPGVPG